MAVAQNNVAKWLANGTKGQNTRNPSSLIDSEPKRKPPFFWGPLKKKHEPTWIHLGYNPPDLKTASSQPHPPSWLLRGRLGALAEGRTWRGLPKLGTQRRVLALPFPFFPSILPRHLLANRSSPGAFWKTAALLKRLVQSFSRGTLHSFRASFFLKKIRPTPWGNRAG